MADATLALNFGVASERTVLNVVCQEPPWRALRAFRNDVGRSPRSSTQCVGRNFGQGRTALGSGVAARGAGAAHSSGSYEGLSASSRRVASGQATFHVGEALCWSTSGRGHSICRTRFEQKSKFICTLAQG